MFPSDRDPKGGGCMRTEGGSVMRACGVCLRVGSRDSLPRADEASDRDCESDYPA